MLIIILSNYQSCPVPLKKTLLEKCTEVTHNVNTLPHSGLSVLYNVCVCNLLLTNSRTQKGSLLPEGKEIQNVSQAVELLLFYNGILKFFKGIFYNPMLSFF